MREHGGRTIIAFGSELEDDDQEWSDETDALSALIPIRAQLARGDLRSLYIGWLLSVQSGELAHEEIEPPVPPGLGDLDGSLDRLVDFLGVDEDLLAVAAATSPALTARSLSRKAIQKWIAGRPSAEKDDYLERFIGAEEPALVGEVQHLIVNPIGALASPTSARTAGSLLRAAEELANERNRAHEEQARMEKATREREAALARSKYLDNLARREPAVWKEIED